MRRTIFASFLMCCCFGLTQAQELTFKTAKFHVGDNKEWSSANFDDSSWKTLDVTQNWDNQGIKNDNNFGWYRFHVKITKSMLENSDLKKYVEFGMDQIDDADETYLNGKLIGTRTWGGLSCLIDDPTYYSLDYSGCFGVENVTPVYVYCPRNISLYGEENKILEGVGITPDIEVTLDTAKYLLNGQDTQLERALEYMKTGN